ncbi:MULTISPECIES: LuxR C-terminal-related transcriptional regulator [unclassified Streptomyces]|uniref:LuxR C-terminal-related transcriptional regulator n=1 Tax=unclassified Streptomyces TaxID=2593676 RepID=UPI000746A8E9|nr:MULTISPECIES: LuxR C-terminal-related transcriptional regulator [unclassified Streptomyces]KUL69640.1 LuxR family transcriptional regulator [Streptomyces sp. NRRL WC-3604]KUL75214.1 LuxR family transcriptional regulator [Streptomyces sp. NRRL WC-3605]
MAESDDIPPGPGSPHADPLGDPFLRTRFALPARPATFLRRARLVHHLDQALRTPLTMVNGAAGAGKTLLVADWAAGLRHPVVWLSLDPSLGGPGMFWAHLLQALRTHGVPVADGVGTPADAGRVPHTLLTGLAAQLGTDGDELTVVLDEYDRIGTPEVAEQLEFVLHHAGPGLHVVLVTRTEPLLPLHRYRASGAITEIRNAELAFTPEETVALLRRHGLRLSVQAAAALVERTGGWAAGLRLCALAAQEHLDPEAYLKEFEAGHSAVADFLLAEVLKRQPSATQDLLLRVSVLERFCPDLANELTGRGDAEAILAGLHRENAFVEDLGHGWYRLHPLFREILRAHLRERSAELEPRLHLRAAHWLGRSGHLPEMLTHGAAAGEWDLTAGALVDDLAIGQLFTGLRTGHLVDLFSGMDPAAASPAADLVRVARDLSRGDLDHALARLGPVRERLAAAGPGGTAAGRLGCALLEALAARVTGSPQRAEDAVRTARELQHELPADLLDKHPELSALLLTHLGSARLWAGDLDEARAALTTVAATTGAATALPRADALELLALIDHLDGRPATAERKASAALAETDRYGLAEGAGTGLGRVVLAAVAVERDDLTEARDLLDGTPGPAVHDPVTAAGRSLATARLLLARGRARAALEAAEPVVPAAVRSPWQRVHTAQVASSAHLAEGRPDLATKVLEQLGGEHPVLAVAAARARLAAGDPDAALGLLDPAGTVVGAGPAVLVRATLLRAQAAHTAGDTATARRLVAQAVAEARHERLRRPFREAGPWIGPYLADAPAMGPGRGALPFPVEPLSGRERDVLLRLAQMMSTEDIAADLYVSVNTVKTHLKSVYRKLAVNRRNDAVRRARELDLL